MKYASWESKEEMKKNLKGVNLQTGVMKSGLPIMYDDEYLYVDDRVNHSLIIGSTGSGKTQAITLPMLRMEMMAGENMIVNDVKGELYSKMADKLTKEGYEVIAVDFENPNLGDSWNPLLFPYKLYKDGYVDRALEMVEDIGYYLLSNDKIDGDSFWTNSAVDYFTGLVLYLFEKGQEDEINLNSIYAMSANGTDSVGKVDYFDLLMNSLDKESNIYCNLSGTLLAPKETRGSIIAVFSQKIKKYITREALSNMMATSSFEINDINNKKMAIFIINGRNTFTNSLVPLFVSQIFNSVDLYGKNRTINILLDEFDTLVPIKDFGRIVNYSRGLSIRFTMFINSYIDLNNTYGIDNADIIKMYFGNIIYLLANDLTTLEEISKTCGNQMTEDGKVEPLITVEELKVFEPFEALALTIRRMPFRTKLLPDYQIDYGYETTEVSIPKRSSKPVKVFDIKQVL